MFKINISILLIFITLFLLPVFSIAQDRNWGIGLTLGDPVKGFSIRKDITQHNIIQVGVGFYGTFYNYYSRKYEGFFFYDQYSFTIHYLWQKKIKKTKRLRVYYGPGINFKRDKTLYYAALGINSMAGLSYQPFKFPINVFLEGMVQIELWESHYKLFSAMQFIPFLPSLGFRYTF